MALNTYTFGTRAVVGRTCQALRLFGEPGSDRTFDADDLASTAAAWCTVQADVGDGKAFTQTRYDALVADGWTMRAPTEAECQAVADAMEAERVAAAAAASDDATNKTNAQAMLDDIASALNRLSVVRSGAQDLSTRTYSGSTANQLLAIRNDVRAIGSGIGEVAKDLVGTIQAIKLAIQRELRRNA